MTYEALPPAGAPKSETDRGLVVLNYIFLLIAPFTLHVLAVVAVILAYIRRPTAPVFEASHYALQIKVFWWSVILFALSILLVFLAVGAGVGAFWQAGFEDAFAFHWGATSVLCLVGAGLCWFASFLVAVIGGLVGLIKLLSNQPAGRR